MDPYLVHETIGNNGNSIRWTAIIKIDDINSNSISLRVNPVYHRRP